MLKKQTKGLELFGLGNSFQNSILGFLQRLSPEFSSGVIYLETFSFVIHRYFDIGG